MELETDFCIVRRVILIVLDSVGIGAMPDAASYGDEGSDTLGNLARALGTLPLPNLASLGLGNLDDIPGTPPQKPLGSCGKMGLLSPGKDTMTGHWEMAGIILEKPFRTYPDGFPPHVIQAFESRIGRPVLGNKPASGTEIIKELGEKHIRTGFPIVYTSADSVFQIACHEEVVPLETLYRWCEIARSILVGDDLVARVIARPFIGEPGNFTRTGNRKDFSLPPIRPTLLDYAKKSGVHVTAVGKIEDIFSGRGIDEAIHTVNNSQGIEVIKSLLMSPAAKVSGAGEGPRHLVFANLVDFDMLYGHRNDVQGYARALLEFDSSLPAVISLLRPDDVLVVTADHGCDPVTPSTDHSREYVPLMIYGEPIKEGIMLGTRESLSDLGATVAELLGIEYRGAGKSFARQILKRTQPG